MTRQEAHFILQRLIDVLKDGEQPFCRDIRDMWAERLKSVMPFVAKRHMLPDSSKEPTFVVGDVHHHPGEERYRTPQPIKDAEAYRKSFEKQPDPDCQLCKGTGKQMVKSRFTCPWCGSHEWGTSQTFGDERDFDLLARGHCHAQMGNGNCHFHWDRSNERQYFSYKEETCTCVRNRCC